MYVCMCVCVCVLTNDGKYNMTDSCQLVRTHGSAMKHLGAECRVEGPFPVQTALQAVKELESPEPLRSFGTGSDGRIED